jgi:hypothetical protein
MADWIRNTVMLTVMAVWTVYVIVAVARGEAREIEPLVWGLPAAVYFALNPTFKRDGRNGSQ